MALKRMLRPTSRLGKITLWFGGLALLMQLCGLDCAVAQWKHVERLDRGGDVRISRLPVVARCTVGATATLCGACATG